MSDADREKRQAMDHDPSIAQVHIDVVDINDNPPHFDKETFYAGSFFVFCFSNDFLFKSQLIFVNIIAKQEWTTAQTVINFC